MKKTAFLFPGQASQYVGMAKDLYGAFKSVRTLFEKASSVMGFDLADVCFNGPEDKLKQTAYTQPAVFVHSCALDMILRENGVVGQAGAGHSLGEYSALVSAGALSFDAALQAIARRSSAMQRDCDEHPGTMAAVMGLEYEHVELILRGISGIVVPANFNSPGQVVIAGEVDAVNDACAELKEAGAKRAIRIPVGGAYHSPLMGRSSKVMAEFIDNGMEFGNFGFPVYTNAGAEPVSEGSEFKRHLIKQISSPVLWYPTIRNLYRDGIRNFVEIGPGRVLQGLVKRSLKDPEIEISGVDTLEEIDRLLSEKVYSA
jgi:[acyl-carrier-protein] S-malonyltransferase